LVAAITVTNLLPNGLSPSRIAARALSSHRSQAFGAFGEGAGPQRPQSFTLVKSVVSYNGPEADLLSGLPPMDAQVVSVPLTKLTANDGPVSIGFVPRPSIQHYRQWVSEQHIEHVAAGFIADVPLVAGERNPVKLTVHNTSATPLASDVKLSLPEGWKIDSDSILVRVKPGQTNLLTAFITPPAGSLVDGDLTASIQSGNVVVTTSARGHPVPHEKVPRLKTPPSLDGTGKGWERLPVHRILPTQLAQGKVANEADSSAKFRLGHDGQSLFVDIEVSDDHVVSNIAPNDIKGHWRSDSVEICIDPAAGAEDTMGCFKVGIFPFDTTGVVRAARDADANQGPIEETAPTMKLVSRRTPDGYRIQAAIPFREIGIGSANVRRLGFNLIIYDGDKTDAALGENINKSRIAWSPRSGVQGRPEDWGRLDLE